METEVVYVNHGIGNQFVDNGQIVIELNENLKKWPELHQAILDHELGHTRKTFTKQDLVADMTEYKVNKKQLLKFMFANPRSLSQFLPIYYTKRRGIVFDINLSIFYGILAFCIGMTIFVSIKYL